MTSREDLYLKKLNDNSVVTPQPVTQREKILSELAGVNGLGVELPTVTASDNGKAIIVENGAWALGNAGGGSGGNIGTGNFIIPFHAIYNPETQQVECTCETTWTEFINVYKSGLVIELRNIVNMYNGEDTYYTPFRLSHVRATDRLDTSTFSFVNLDGIYCDSGNVTGWTWTEIRVKKDTNSTEDAISFELLTHQATLNDKV